MVTKFPKARTKETIIAEWVSGRIPDPFGGDTREVVTRAMLAGLFYTAARLVEIYECDGAQFQELSKITLGFQKAGWSEQFVLRLTKIEEG